MYQFQSRFYFQSSFYFRFFFLKFSKVFYGDFSWFFDIFNLYAAKFWYWTLNSVYFQNHAQIFFPDTALLLFINPIKEYQLLVLLLVKLGIKWILLF